MFQRFAFFLQGRESGVVTKNNASYNTAGTYELTVPKGVSKITTYIKQNLWNQMNQNNKLKRMMIRWNSQAQPAKAAVRDYIQQAVVKGLINLGWRNSIMALWQVVILKGWRLSLHNVALNSKCLLPYLVMGFFILLT